MIDKLMNLPNPIEILMDPASIIVISIFLVLMIAEELVPGRPLPKIKYWKIKGVIAFVFYFFLSTYLPMFWNDTLAQYQLVDLSFLGDVGGAIVALLIYEFGVYIWHRSMHKSNILSVLSEKFFLWT
jgi:sterol desaturase/sphingolipid hydroxylase (fatty acid hydroxylase superfamily)